jgi:hypothetical protein
VLKSEFALQPRLVCDIFAKRRRQGTHDVCGDLHEERHKEEALAANAAREAVVVDDDVEDGFREVGVQFRK